MEFSEVPQFQISDLLLSVVVIHSMSFICLKRRRISFNHEDVGRSPSQRGKKGIAANSTLVQPCPILVGPYYEKD